MAPGKPEAWEPLKITGETFYWRLKNWRLKNMERYERMMGCVMRDTRECGVESAECGAGLKLRKNRASRQEQFITLCFVVCDKGIIPEHFPINFF
jgi:hypothetical protein